ncbi:MAG: protein kinase [Deltaproteobacteria bacterium]|nr:protein kinase [Deltaproteobacteria bacterium]
MSGPPQSPPDVEAIAGFSDAPEELVGRLLDGRYLVDAVLGKGGMAVVLGARHVFLGRRVAIKVLHPQLLALDEMKARFLREARAASLVQHPAVISVTDFGVATTPGGSLHYLVMEHLEGEDLLAWSERRGMASPEEVRAIGMQLADGLAAIHAAGFVHRDVKPENVWVLAEPDADGMPRVKLLDLGIAALVDDPGVGHGAGRGRAHRLTRAGQTLGTALYMSPEQAMGGRLDGRSDLYAVGSVLWELACDACMFDGTSPLDIMQKQTVVRPAAPSTVNPEVPAWLDAIILRCLEKRPEDRFVDAHALRDALAARSLGPDHEPEPEPAHEPEPTIENEDAWRTRRPVGLWVGAWLALVVIVVVLLLQPWRRDEVEHQPTPPTIVVITPEPRLTTPEPEPEPRLTTPEPEPEPRLTKPEPEPEPRLTKPEPEPEPRVTTPEPEPEPATTITTPPTRKPPRPKPPTTTTTTAPATTAPPGSELWRPERPVSP